MESKELLNRGKENEDMVYSLSHRVSEVLNKSGKETEKVIIDLLTSLTVREVLVTEEAKKVTEEERKVLRGGNHSAKMGKNRTVSSRL